MPTQARSIASLTISFGLVAIPVKLYSATVSSERISFNLLRQKDGSRVKQQYIAVADGKPVERSEMVKGYEFAKDQYVMFTAEELKALEDTTTHAIDIGQFVPAAVGRSRCISTAPITSLPTRAAQSPTRLLATALRKAGQCAVGRWVSRGKEHIVVIRPMEDGLAHASAALQGRGARPQGSRHRAGAGVGARVEARPAAHRSSGREALRSQRVPRRVQGTRRGGHPEEDPGPGRSRSSEAPVPSGRRQRDRSDGGAAREHRCARLEGGRA